MTAQPKKKRRRRRFTEREVLMTLIHQGVRLTSYRSGEPITLENVHLAEREHLHEVGLDGPDEPENCRYSLKAEHSIITNGTKASSAGSSKHRIAKVKRVETGKMDVDKRPLRSRKERARIKPRKPWPKRQFRPYLPNRS